MILAGRNVRESRVKRLLLRKLEVQARHIVTVEIDAFDIRLSDQDPHRMTLVARRIGQCSTRPFRTAGRPRGAISPRNVLRSTFRHSAVFASEMQSMRSAVAI